jgi:tetratricopeptide (TPR) repeat protein
MIESLNNLKATVFLNLAASNLKLKNTEGALKCLHVVIQFCNNPNLLVCEMNSTDDHVVLNEPVTPCMTYIAIKALYRRGCCFMDTKNYQKAYQDFLNASRLSPKKDDLIERLLNESKTKLMANKRSAIMSNGGKCWLRNGLWSQTVQEVCNLHI